MPEHRSHYKSSGIVETFSDIRKRIAINVLHHNVRPLISEAICADYGVRRLAGRRLGWAGGAAARVWGWVSDAAARRPAASSRVRSGPPERQQLQWGWGRWS